jgi:hypothetical protein
MTHRITALALTASLALTAAPATAAPQVGCTSAKAGLADRLARDITAALAGRSGTVALGVRDRTTDTTCLLRPDTSFDAASVVKVTVLAVLLWDAERQGRTLTAGEKRLAAAMITRSDNSATDTLWQRLGTAKVRRFLTAAGMPGTELNPWGYWGLTRIDVGDQQRLLALITTRNTVLGDASRTYLLELMGTVVPEQRWGTPAGAPAGVSVHVKNGWLPRATLGWRVHSVGAFRGAGHDYTISVLTHGNSTMRYGVDTVQRVARAVHRDLAPDARSDDRYTPTADPQEVIPPVPD